MVPPGGGVKWGGIMVRCGGGASAALAPFVHARGRTSARRSRFRPLLGIVRDGGAEAEPRDETQAVAPLHAPTSAFAFSSTSAAAMPGLYTAEPMPKPS